jgi:starch synthase
VVATRVGGLPELVDDTRTGILVPPRDPAALARAIVQLLHDPERRAALGTAGQQRATAFDMDRMVEGTLAVYGQLLQARRG